jgi:hypothetical protein
MIIKDNLFLISNVNTKKKVQTALPPLSISESAAT